MSVHAEFAERSAEKWCHGISGIYCMSSSADILVCRDKIHKQLGWIKAVQCIEGFQY